MSVYICDNCHNKFSKDKKRNTKNNFCNKKCYYEWLKTHPNIIPPMPGKSNPRYLHDVDHSAICERCGKTFVVGGYKAKLGTARFCSKKCRQEWYAHEWSQSDEWKQNRREWAVSLLENETISQTNSEPQRIVNDILDNLNIRYANEKSYNNFAVDNYLYDYNLVIEVMGTYWHCDQRKFGIIRYENQVNRIRMDKIKHSCMVNTYGVEILYLWEYDINNNPDLINLLILAYINNNGNLPNYNSFNYEISDGMLYLKNEIDIPYMDWKIEDLNNIVCIKVKGEMSRKQDEKWITFKCEQCGNLKEELIVHYKNSKHHFCSYKCASAYRLVRRYTE